MSAGIFVTDVFGLLLSKLAWSYRTGSSLVYIRSSLATWMISIAKTDLKTAQGTLRGRNPQIMLARYAPSADEMVAA